MFKKLIRYLRNADAKEAEAQRKTHEEYIGWEQQRKKKRLEKTIEDKRSWQERLLTDEQKHFRDLFVSKLDHEPLETGHKIMTDIDDVYVYEMLELIDAIETKGSDKKKKIEESARFVEQQVIFFNNSAGVMLPGSRHFFYEAGTVTTQAVYSDKELTTPIVQPVLADASGILQQIWLQPLPYRWVGEDVNSVQLFDRDDVNFAWLRQNALLGGRQQAASQGQQLGQQSFGCEQQAKDQLLFDVKFGVTFIDHRKYIGSGSIQ